MIRLFVQRLRRCVFQVASHCRSAGKEPGKIRCQGGTASHRQLPAIYDYLPGKRLVIEHRETLMQFARASPLFSLGKSPGWPLSAPS